MHVRRGVWGGGAPPATFLGLGSDTHIKQHASVREMALLDGCHQGHKGVLCSKVLPPLKLFQHLVVLMLHHASSVVPPAVESSPQAIDGVSVHRTKLSSNIGLLGVLSANCASFSSSEHKPQRSKRVNIVCENVDILPNVCYIYKDIYRLSFTRLPFFLEFLLLTMMTLYEVLDLADRLGLRLGLGKKVIWYRYAIYIWLW